MTKTYWWCFHCEATGEYVHTAKGEMTGLGTPMRHTKDTHHSTFSSLHPRPAHKSPEAGSSSR